MAHPEYAHPQQFPSSEEVERLEKMIQHDYLDCVAALSPEPLALFPDGSANPRRDDDKTKQQYTGLEPQLTLPQINGSLAPDSTDSLSVIKFAYPLLPKADWEQRSNNIIFEYCQDLLSLLKKFHGATKSDERFHWLNLLHDLVYVRMTEKLHGRVIDVFEKHNFGTICMTSVDQLASQFKATSMAELLASFKGNNGKPLPNEEQLALAEFFDGHKTAHSEDLTYHAEGIGICAYVLARVRDEVVNHNVDHETADKSLLLPRREITDHFRKIPIPMAVNKRCCAVCHIMLEILERESGHKFLCLGASFSSHSGSHSDWSSVSIPRWLPKKFFNSLYDQVESVLRDGLQWIVKEKGLARSNENGNSSDPNGDSARFIARMTMRDNGGRPRPVKPQEPEEPQEPCSG
ncbi:hypothetical protein K456DRAFT_42670 [Colletotrichum gloeosporioides 23]|nr:hypothetical protein K456DRAFT_42670 [Colletotrichum gloeosporioides 23]